MVNSQLIVIMKYRMNTIRNISPMRFTTPSDKSDDSASISLVVLVIRRPMGFLSKNWTCNDWIFWKTSTLSWCKDIWPNQRVMYVLKIKINSSAPNVARMSKIIRLKPSISPIAMWSSTASWVSFGRRDPR